MKLSTTIVIPTYNGLTLLKKYLPSVVKNSHTSTIIIVDDASTDASKEWVSETYPEIIFVKHKENKGFSGAVNTGFKKASTDLILLLNNDVELLKDTLPNLKKKFIDNKNLFGVGALELLPSGNQRGRSVGEIKRGLVVHRAAEKLSAGPTFWVFGASGLFDRKKWLILKGLDELYFPAYWEDIDIGYRAWKYGYECLFEPTAQLKHLAEATMNKELGFMKNVYAFKNQILFFWKNIDQPKYLVQHIVWMPYHLLVTSFKSRGAFFVGFILATLQMAQVFSQEVDKEKQRSDSEIFDIFSHKP